MPVHHPPGIETAPMAREPFVAYVRAETKKWVAAIKAAGIEPE